MGVSRAQVASSGGLTNLITGNDSDFAASLGAWANTGGTMSRDTAVKMPGFTASLKYLSAAFATSHIDLALGGTYLANKTYMVILLISGENTRPVYSVQFGLIGTDSITSPTDIAYEPNGSFEAVALPWTPSADRTGVSIRIDFGSASARTMYLGWALVFQTETQPVLFNKKASPSNGGGSYLPRLVGENSGASSIGANTYSALRVFRDGAVDITTPDNTSGLSVNSGSNGIQAHAEGTVADLADKGVRVEVGVDYVGFYIGEKDTDTVQLYADVAGGYKMELRDRGSGKGWQNDNGDAVRAKITDSFQWSLYVAGAQTTGTDKAPYFQAPAKCIIDEVRIHLGTAPTGATFIVDVNDDGTTIFTTQGNRPTIAISGTDDTSGAPDGGTAVAKDSVMSVDVDQIGSTIAGSDLVIFIRGRYIW